MTEQQILMIRNSWQLFANMDPHQIGHIFYSRLFLQMPSLRPMFKSNMSEQYQKLVDMLILMVSKLDRPDELDIDIIALAQRHVEYGVESAHYKLVGDALLFTLAKGAGKDWTDEMALAWADWYEQLSQTMIRASEGIL